MDSDESFQQLSKAVKHHVFSFLSARELARGVFAVCRDFHAASADGRLYSNIDCTPEVDESTVIALINHANVHLERISLLEVSTVSGATLHALAAKCSPTKLSSVTITGSSISGKTIVEFVMSWRSAQTRVARDSEFNAIVPLRLAFRDRSKLMRLHEHCRLVRRDRLSVDGYAEETCSRCRQQTLAHPCPSSACGKYTCLACLEFLHCGMCGEYSYCPSCVVTCDSCPRPLCPICVDTCGRCKAENCTDCAQSCSVCDRAGCKQCVRACFQCREPVCAVNDAADGKQQCSGRACYSCETALCHNCMFECSLCSNVCCAEGRCGLNGLAECCDCNKFCCFDCDAGQCSNCIDRVCGKCGISHCGVCDSAYCKSCARWRQGRCCNAPLKLSRSSAFAHLDEQKDAGAAAVDTAAAGDAKNDHNDGNS